MLDLDWRSMTVGGGIRIRYGAAGEAGDIMLLIHDFSPLIRD